MRQESPEGLAKAGAIFNSQRSASLKYWTDKQIRGESPEDYVFCLTATILPLDVAVKIDTHQEPDDVYSYNMQTESRDRLSLGCAVPITDDGYFLTAAHCVDKAGSAILVVNTEKQLVRLPARVIWTAGKNRKQPDLALVHARVRPFASVALVEIGSLKNGAHVYTSGLGAGGSPNLVFGQSGGRILDIQPIRRGGAGAIWRQFYHSAPLAPGDSGGPVIDEFHGRKAIFKLQRWRRNPRRFVDWGFDS